MEIIETIEKYNLSIRRIPNTITSCYEISHLQEGDEIVLSNGRKFAKRITIPKNAGKYMVKAVDNNSSMVQWNSKKDNLADTLEESIKLFLSDCSHEKIRGLP